MPSIFPNVAAGGVPSTSPSASNSYTFGEDFTSTCNETALPEDCSARILPGQINAIVSELKCFTETLTPEGTWNCGDLCNLGTAFEGWESTHKLPDNVTIVGTGTLGDGYRVSAPGVADAICANDPAAQALAACVRSGDAPNAITIGSDGKLVATPQNIVAGICATDAAGDALATCLMSTTAPNSLNIGPDGRLMVSPADIVSDLCATPASRNALASCVLSQLEPNSLEVAGDGGLIVEPTVVVADICNTPAARNALASCVRSGDNPNLLTVGSDGRLVVTPQVAVAGICGDATARNALSACLISGDAGNGLGLGTDGRLLVGAGASSLKMADDGVFRVGATATLHTCRRDLGFGATVPGSELSLWIQADSTNSGASNPVRQTPVQTGTWRNVTNASNEGDGCHVAFFERIA